MINIRFAIIVLVLVCAPFPYNLLEAKDSAIDSRLEGLELLAPEMTKNNYVDNHFGIVHYSPKFDSIPFSATFLQGVSWGMTEPFPPIFGKDYYISYKVNKLGYNNAKKKQCKNNV